MRISALALALAALAAVSCSTSYFPRPTRTVRMTLNDGSLTFWKDGKVVQKGTFGSGLAEAISDVPEAAAHARTWRSRNLAGLVLSGVGLATSIGGLAIIDPGGGYHARNTASLTMLIGGAVLGIIGAMTAASAQGHLFDALNLYDDKVRGR